VRRTTTAALQPPAGYEQLLPVTAVALTCPALWCNSRALRPPLSLRPPNLYMLLTHHVSCPAMAALPSHPIPSTPL